MNGNFGYKSVLSKFVPFRWLLFLICVAYFMAHNFNYVFNHFSAVISVKNFLPTRQYTKQNFGYTPVMGKIGEGVFRIIESQMY